MDILYMLVTLSANIYNCTYSWVARQAYVVQHTQYRYFKNIGHRVPKKHVKQLNINGERENCNRRKQKIVECTVRGKYVLCCT